MIFEVIFLLLAKEWISKYDVCSWTYGISLSDLYWEIVVK